MQQRSHFNTVVAILVASVLLGNLWGFHFLLTPFRYLTVAVHELCHAVACVLTGGWVSGLTIVADGEGHGGLTFTHGGLTWLVASAGYVGTAIVGCGVLLLSRHARVARPVLGFIGVLMAVCTLFLVPRTVMFEHGRILQTLGSLGWGLLLSGLLCWAAWKLEAEKARTLLILVGAETALSAVSSTWTLLVASAFVSGVTSDAGNMAAVTGVPAVIWSLLWAAFALLSLGFTLRYTYRTR